MLKDLEAKTCVCICVRLYGYGYGRPAFWRDANLIVYIDEMDAIFPV